MLKPGIKSRNKFNMSKKNYILERKLSHHFNNIYINDNKEQNSSNNSSKKEFDNELLIKSLKKKSKKKNNLKDLLFNKRNINTNTNKERKNLIISKSKKNINNNSNNKKNDAPKRRINSARPLLKYNRNFNEIENNFNLNELFNNNDQQKIVAFKENILVHEKTLSLSDFSQDKNKDNDNKNQACISYINGNSPKSYKRKSSKFYRPKSAIFGGREENNRIKINKSKINNILVVPTKIFDDNYYDLSYVLNSDNNLNHKNTKNKFQKNKNQFNCNNKKKVLKPSYFNFLSEYSMKNKIFSFNNPNLKLNTSKMKTLNKKIRGRLLRRKPIPLLNQNYLLYVPNELKKLSNNKYNFFNNLFSENIYYNTINNKIIEPEIFGKKADYILTSKNKNFIFTSKHKNNDNKTKKNNKNLQETHKDNTYKINCRKEEEFMSYLKKMDYNHKHPQILKNSKTIITTNHSSRVEMPNYMRSRIYNINNINKIYKPVKIRIENSSEYKTLKRAESEKCNIKRNINEENEFFDKIKSNPFLKKKGI